MKKYFFCVVFFLVISSIAICSPKGGSLDRRQFIASANMPSSGLRLTATVIALSSDAQSANAAVEEVFQSLKVLDLALMDAALGEVSKINALKKDASITLSDNLFSIIEKSVHLSELTNGWFDLTAPSHPGWPSSNDYRKILLSPAQKNFTFKSKGMKIDLMPIWPAYLVDKAVEEFTRRGFSNMKVEVQDVSRNVGADIYTPWQIVVSLPDFSSTNASRAYAYGFSNKAVALIKSESASIIDPKLKRPVGANFKSVAVFANDAATASAFAQALYTLGHKFAPAMIEAHPEIKAVLVQNDGLVLKSKDMVFHTPDYTKEAPPVFTTDVGPRDEKLKEE